MFGLVSSRGHRGEPLEYIASYPLAQMCDIAFGGCWGGSCCVRRNLAAWSAAAGVGLAASASTQTRLWSRHKWCHAGALVAVVAAAAACRPEADFSSLEALVTRIHKDGDMSREALSQPELQRFASDSFLQPLECLQQQVQPQSAADTDAAAGAVVDAADELVEVGACG